MRHCAPTPAAIPRNGVNGASQVAKKPDFAAAVPLAPAPTPAVAAELAASGNAAITDNAGRRRETRARVIDFQNGKAAVGQPLQIIPMLVPPVLPIPVRGKTG